MKKTRSRKSRDTDPLQDGGGHLVKLLSGKNRIG
jgi:hypothetical protein